MSDMFGIEALFRPFRAWLVCGHRYPGRRPGLICSTPSASTAKLPRALPWAGLLNAFGVNRWKSRVFQTHLESVRVKKVKLLAQVFEF